MKNRNNEGNLKIGHRSRVRKRAAEGAVKSFCDYELLELLLFSANARSDTRALAADMILKFKSLSCVFSATKNELQMLFGVGDSVVATIFAVREIMQRILLSELQNVPIISNWKKLLDYLSVSLGYLKKEAVIILYLDKGYKLLDRDIYDFGTIDHVPLYIREVVGQAIAICASAIIMVHNHPCGNISPSNSDIATTRRLISACEGVDIQLLDHVIVSGNKFFSFKNEGLI